jgi:hypothetical protein
MSITTTAILTPEERSRLAAMPELGGGNLLATAMAVHPDRTSRSSARAGR